MLYTYNNESDKKNLIDNFFDGVKEKTFLYIILGNKKKITLYLQIFHNILNITFVDIVNQ